jgi:hypothetical protein
MAKLLGREGGRVFYNQEQWDEWKALPACEYPGCAILEDLVNGTKLPGRKWPSTSTRSGAFSEEYEPYCFGCAFWLEKFEADKHRDSAIVLERRSSLNGELERWHYSYNADQPIVTGVPRSHLGHAGAHWNIKFHDGREVRTNDLWCQGDIPTWFWDKFPVNATV